MGAMVSPLTGADGNVEFLVHVRPDSAVATGRRPDRRWRPGSTAGRRPGRVAEPGGLTWPRSAWSCTTTGAEASDAGPRGADVAGRRRPRGAAAEPRRRAGRSPRPGVDEARLRRGARPGREPRRRRHHAAHRRPRRRPRACPSSASTSASSATSTEVEPAGLHDALERFLAGDYEVEERMMLDVRGRRAARPPSAPRWPSTTP